ncbi:MAG: Rho termination factor N-terminal domain-containing protein [Nitriliruptorales bacterium]|nr:Rho termination factor N-terminal domain-containing protein [Nitriliruptorales bacterium]
MRDQIKDASKLLGRAVSETGYALIGLGSTLVSTVTDEDTPKKVSEASSKTVDATRQAGFALTRGFLQLADRGKQVLPPDQVRKFAGRGADEVARRVGEARSTAGEARTAATAKATETKQTASATATDVTTKDFSDMTVEELREEARKAGIEGRSNMNKGLLVAALKRKSAKSS